jgi:hypothetical protein
MGVWEYGSMGVDVFLIKKLPVQLKKNLEIWNAKKRVRICFSGK